MKLINKITSQVNSKRLVQYLDDYNNKGFYFLDLPIVYTNEDQINLFDAINKNYPIDPFIFFCSSKIQFKIKNEITNDFISNHSHNKYVLKGQINLHIILSNLIYLYKSNNIKLDIDETKLVHYDSEYDLFFIPENKELTRWQLPVYAIIDTFLFLNKYKKNYYADDFNFSSFKQEEFYSLEAELFLERIYRLANNLVDLIIPSYTIYSSDINYLQECYNYINDLSKDSNHLKEILILS